MTTSRLTALDGSFLRVESPAAHMHIAWKGYFAPRPDGRPLTVAALRRAVAGRLHQAPRFRQRLAYPPAGLAEPVWVDDERFDIDRHVVALSEPGQVLTVAAFDELADRALSQPLARDRPLWRVLLAPRLDDGTVGLVMAVHHAMVDGQSAVELALLLLDLTPDAPTATPDDWEAAPPPSPTRMALDALADRGGESLRLAGGLARIATSPSRGLRLADTLRRAALSVGDDVLRPAPASLVNVPIGPTRRLVHHTTPVAPLLAVKHRFHASLNDVALTVVAGALRQMVLTTGCQPAALRVMVPISGRDGSEPGATGNRLSCAFIDLPVERSHPVDRLLAVRAACGDFKRGEIARAHETVIDALSLLPGLLKGPAVRLASSPKLFNLTVSNIPGPRVPVYLLGAEMREAVPVVPLPEGHALSVGIFTYADKLVFGCFADPVALPAAAELPAALAASVEELVRLGVRPPSPAPRQPGRRRRAPVSSRQGTPASG